LPKHSYRNPFSLLLKNTWKKGAEMAVRFNLYYFSEDAGNYLHEVVNTTPQSRVTHAALLSKSLPDQAHNEADVYFVEYNDQIPELDHWIEKLQHQTDHAAIFLYLREASTACLLKALRLGVQECFVAHISAEDFQKALQRLLKAKTTLNPGEKTQIISLLGCKGGAGVTFMAVNLAQSLAAGRQEPVLLFDLDLRASNVSSFLDIQPRYTILDVIENFDRIDPQYLKDIIHSTESGIDVLPGPPRIEDSELVQAHHVEKVLQYIRSLNHYRWILLDLGDLLDEITLKALEISDLGLLITLLTIPGLRDAKKISEMLQLLGFGKEKISLVVNCHSKANDIKVAEAIKFLGQDFLGILSFDHDAVIRSINEGQPLVKTQPNHRLTADFAGLVQKLYPDGDENGKPPGIFNRLKLMLRLRK
jgi:pilus assembly protein CpaE